MRLAANRYALQSPVIIKKQRADTKHLAPPLKGMSLYAKTSGMGDPMTAPILDNWIVEEDRITVRPGSKLLQTLPEAKAVQTILPYYGSAQDIAPAVQDKVYDSSNAVLGSGFTSGTWSWTSFSNLSDVVYTVAVNGAQGVWAWDGGSRLPSASITVTKLSKTNPAKATVVAGDIAKFISGGTVNFAGATGDMVAANGLKIIGAVDAAGLTFELAGVDLSSAAADQTTGLSAVAGGSFEKQPVTAPPGALNVIVNNLDKVLSHQNRLWFADRANLAIFYLPLQQKAGELTAIPLNAIFKRGGFVRAIYTWTLDGGMGMDDNLVVFSSNGECAIWKGIDPEVDMELIGVFRFDSPMSMHSIVNYGGDLYVMTGTGLIPMTTLLRAETEKLGKFDQDIQSAFTDISERYRSMAGWQVILDHRTGLAICNMPLGSPNRYKQMVRKMSGGQWTSWSNLQSRSWQWIRDGVVYGSDDGKIYALSKDYMNDEGTPIVADVQWAWSQFGYPGVKQFKMLRVYTASDGFVQPYLDMRVDYNAAPLINRPDVGTGEAGAEWDLADWNESDWALGVTAGMIWQGVTGLGVTGGARVTVSLVASHFSITGIDVLFETGGILG